jgi:quercetin dioxygenase-like cupin family protein
MSDPTRTPRPVVVRADRTRVLASGGVRIRLHLEARHGAPVSICTFEVAPGASGPPVPHHHTREEATFLVVEGTLALTAAGELHRLTAGDLVHLPRGVDCAGRNGSDAEPLTVQCSYAPAGCEGMFVDRHEARDGHGLTPESMRRVVPPLWRTYGIGISERGSTP